MINIKNAAEIEIMRQSGKILKDVLCLIEENIKIGVATEFLDKLAYDYIKKAGGAPTFLNYNGYPKTLCCSVDEEVVHGIPSARKLEEGMIVGIDCGVFYKGFNTDAARTFAVGKITAQKQKLMDVTKECFFKALAVIKEGVRLGDIGAAVQKHAESNGFSVVRAMTGHGIGRKLHEDPEVLNYGTEGTGLRLNSGTTIAVEPMINLGGYEIEMLKDGWTMAACDRKPSAHYENTVVILKEGAEMLTE